MSEPGIFVDDNDEEKINELLKKLEEFEAKRAIIPNILSNKPLYVEKLEEEIQYSLLRNNEYIEIPLNPITDYFSPFIVRYFLARDGFYGRYVNGVRQLKNLYVEYPEDVIEIDIVTESSFYNLYLVRLKQSSVLLIKLPGFTPNDYIEETIRNLYYAVDSTYYEECSEPPLTNYVYDEEIGLIFYISCGLSAEYVFPSLASAPPEQKIIVAKSSFTKKTYNVIGYVATHAIPGGNMASLLIVHKDELMNYIEKVFKDYFKKKG